MKKSIKFFRFFGYTVLYTNTPMKLSKSSTISDWVTFIKEKVDIFTGGVCTEKNIPHCDHTPTLGNNQKLSLFLCLELKSNTTDQRLVVDFYDTNGAEISATPTEGTMPRYLKDYCKKILGYRGTWQQVLRKIIQLNLLVLTLEPSIAPPLVKEEYDMVD